MRHLRLKYPNFIFKDNKKRLVQRVRASAARKSAEGRSVDESQPVTTKEKMKSESIIIKDAQYHAKEGTLERLDPFVVNDGTPKVPGGHFDAVVDTYPSHDGLVRKVCAKRRVVV